MALIVEDGSGLAAAESYISVADADARHAAFGNAGWTGTEPAKEQALRRATAYMLQAYRDRWSGSRRTTTQALCWPRNDVTIDRYSYVDFDTVPDAVAAACADLALRALTDDLNPDLTRGIVRERVGPLETEYDRHAPQSTRYRSIDMMLAPYLTGGGAMLRLSRT